MWMSDGWETLDNAPTSYPKNGNIMVNADIKLNQIHTILFLVVTH